VRNGVGVHIDHGTQAELLLESSNLSQGSQSVCSQDIQNELVQTQTELLLEESQEIIDDNIHDYSSSYLNIASVNVCGLNSKLRYPEFTEFCNKYDLIALCETKLDSIDVKNVSLENYDFVYVNRKKCNRASGGIGIFVKSSLVEQGVFSVLQCDDYDYDNILPFRLSINDKIVTSVVVYVEPENSRYAKNDAFERIENVLKSLGEGPYLILGDLNARTKCLNELMIYDSFNVDINDNTEEVLRRKYEEELMFECGVPERRVSQDTKTNNYGYQLIDMLKHLGLVIMNGRCGKDRFSGDITCKDRSIVDYGIASPWLLPLVNDFEILDFNECWSDVHRAISIQIKCSIHNEDVCEDEITDGPKETVPKWRQEFVQTLVTSIDLQKVMNLQNDLDLCRDKIISQEGIDILYGKLKDILQEAGTRCGSLKVKSRRKNKKKVKQEWWNEECQEARNYFFQARKKCSMRMNEDSFAARREANKKYKKAINKAMNDYKKDIVVRIRKLQSKNPKEYWEIINKCNTKRKEEVLNKISCEAFAEHFKDLNFDDQPREENKTSFDGTNSELLNGAFTEEEIEKCVKKLKNNKACGLDKILNEFIIHTFPTLKQVYINLFNLALKSGVVPTDWTIGVIVPIYKNKGSISDVDNYRGITLLSCIGKLFTLVLNDRVKLFLEDRNLLGEEQAGFRNGYSTIDHVFTLNFIVNLYLQKKKKVFCAFVDYRKAFDSIDRICLWRKLIAHGIDGLILKVVKYMYDQAKSCVRSGNIVSDYFECNVGVRQGENLSPVLFALFKNDLVDFMHNKCIGLQELGKEINKYLSDEETDVYLRLYLLLYADDTVIMAESADDLQTALNVLADYCDENKLVVNSSKTKILVFSRGVLRNLPSFTFNNMNLEIVKSYQYLGIIFNYNGRFNVAQKDLADKAVRAMFSVLAKGKKLGLPIDLMLKIFDHTVKPILLYGSEVWGTQIIDLLERVQLRFIKTYLRLQRRTPSVMVRGETGCFPLKVDITCRVLSYWFKLVKDQKDHKISNMLYKCIYNMFIDGSYKCKWIQYVKDKLDNLGMSDIFLSQANEINLVLFKAMVKQRCQDQYVQEWNIEVFNNSLCSNYRLFKKNFILENYLVKLPINLAINFLRFRTRSIFNIINEENVQWFGGDCLFCTSKCMDEFHLVMECVHFQNDRLSIKDKRFFTNVNCIKFEYMMSDDHLCLKVAKLCHKISIVLKDCKDTDTSC